MNKRLGIFILIIVAIVLTHSQISALPHSLQIRHTLLGLLILYAGYHVYKPKYYYRIGNDALNCLKGNA